jgi:hypothetical protein
MNQLTNNTATVQSIDIEQMYTEQSEAEALYELAVTYKSFGFRNKAVIEYHKLCELRTESANIFLKRLTPQLFH